MSRVSFELEMRSPPGAYLYSGQINLCGYLKNDQRYAKSVNGVSIAYLGQTVN